MKQKTEQGSASTLLILMLEEKPSINLSSFKDLYFICVFSMCVCVCVCIPCLCSAYSVKKRASDPLGLKLQMIVSYQVDAGN